MSPFSASIQKQQMTKELAGQWQPPTTILVVAIAKDKNQTNRNGEPSNDNTHNTVVTHIYVCMYMHYVYICMHLIEMEEGAKI